LSFSDNDRHVDVEGSESIVTVPKDEDNLEIMRKTRDLAEMSFGDGDDDEDESERLNIGDDVKLDIVDINDLNKPSVDLNPPPILEFEVLT
jgi:ribosomal protein S1